MPSLSEVRDSNAKYCPSYVPVIVITGGTSGIGQGLAQAFAHYVHGGAHIILVGRNRVAADAIIASLPKSTMSTYEFIYCDVTLMKNVHVLARELSDRLPKINFLVHCAGVLGLKGRKETEEGIDRKLASRYYSRWALTNDLLPLLRKAHDADEDASVVSVLAAGHGSKIDLEDLGLKKKYSGTKAMLQSASYNDLMVAVSDLLFFLKKIQFIILSYRLCLYTRNSPGENLKSHLPMSSQATSTPASSNSKIRFWLPSPFSSDHSSGSC